MTIKAFQLSLAALALGLFVGCPSEKKDEFQSYSDAEQNTDDHGHDHDHDHEGPHGGHIIELTDDHSVHLEVVMGTDRSITLYVLGGDLETAIPVKVDEIEFELDQEDGNEIELKLTPQPLEGEPEGTASVFVIAADQVPESIKDIEGLHGHVHITIDGKELEGALSHDHDHDHDHDHGDEKKDDKKVEADSPADGEEKQPEGES